MSTTPQIIPTSPYPEDMYSALTWMALSTTAVFIGRHTMTKLKRLSMTVTTAKWYMDIVGSNNIVNVKGIALLGGCDLLEPYAYSELGSLLMLDTSGAAEDPNFAGMGTRFELRYLPKAINEQILTEIGYL